MKTATVGQLRKEVSELREAGRQMSQVCYRLSGVRKLTEHDCGRLAELVRNWDAIPRSEK